MRPLSHRPILDKNNHPMTEDDTIVAEYLSIPRGVFRIQSTLN